MSIKEELIKRIGDGVRCLPEPSVDDFPGRIHGYLVEILHEIVSGGLRGPK